MKKQALESIPINDLIPQARNSRTHSPEQIAQIAASIREFGFTNPVLIDKDGTIIAGHGRVMAARKLDLATVPCLRLGHLTPQQVRAYVIADNKLALNAGWDEEMLKAELDGLKEEGQDLELTGFSKEELEELFSNVEDILGDNYTHKVDSPVYTPKGDKPAIAELVDSGHAKKLISEIEEAELPEDVAQFLKAAAARHFVFNYEKIAEFYCHADKKTQELMENSALVIIDFRKALQMGYAKLKTDLADLISEQEQEPHA